MAILCGGCGASIPRGDPYVEVVLPGMKRRMTRCSTCADGPVPVDLPPLVEHPPTSAMLPVMALAKPLARPLPIDFKQRASREPGEDDE